MAISTSYCDEFYLYICSTDLWHELIWDSVVRILSYYVLLYFHTVSDAERITVNQIQSSSQRSIAEQHDTHTEGDTPSDQPYQRLVCNIKPFKSHVKCQILLCWYLRLVIVNWFSKVCLMFQLVKWWRFKQLMDTNSVQTRSALLWILKNCGEVTKQK